MIMLVAGLQEPRVTLRGVDDHAQKIKKDVKRRKQSMAMRFGNDLTISISKKLLREDW